MSYQPGIPTGIVPLDTDYLNLQTNFQQLDTQFGIDHIPFSNTGGNPPNGYHESVHLNPQSTTVTNPPNNYDPITNYPQGVPTVTPGFGQLFSSEVNDGINTDQALFFLTGGNRLIPLTRNVSPFLANNGYTFLAGGLILQWGKVTGLSGSWPTTQQPVNFATANINFPTNCFAVFTTFIGPTSSSTGDITINSVTNTLFRWQFSGSSSASFDGFYWVALGK